MGFICTPCLRSFPHFNEYKDSPYSKNHNLFKLTFISSHIKSTQTNSFPYFVFRLPQSLLTLVVNVIQLYPHTPAMSHHFEFDKCKHNIAVSIIFLLLPLVNVTALEQQYLHCSMQKAQRNDCQA